MQPQPSQEGMWEGTALCGARAQPAGQDQDSPGPWSAVLTTWLPTEAPLLGADSASAGRRQVVSAVGKPADQRPGHRSAQEPGPGQGRRARRPIEPRPEMRNHSSLPPPGPHLCTRSTRWAISLSEMPGQDSSARLKAFSSSSSAPTPPPLCLCFSLSCVDTQTPDWGPGGGLPIPPDLPLGAGGSAAPGSP